MKNSKKTLVALAAGALIFALTAANGFARGGPGMGGMGGKGFGGGGPGICNPLNPALNEQQRQRLYELREAYLKDITPIQNELMTKKLELRNLWSAPNPDQAKIMEKQREVNRLQERIQERATKYRLDCQGVLTGSSSTSN
ncbi:MAG: Spy/CpxP family protein refolding chaperone [Desulfatiglandales bacterium]